MDAYDIFAIIKHWKVIKKTKKIVNQRTGYFLIKFQTKSLRYISNLINKDSQNNELNKIHMLFQKKIQM